MRQVADEADPLVELLGRRGRLAADRLAASTYGLLVVAGHDVRLQANGDLANPVSAARDVLFGVVIAGTLVAWLAWLVIQIPTYRRASGERRQQLKWLYSGAGIFVAVAVIGVFIVPVAMGEAPGWGTQPVVGALTTSERAPCRSAWGWRC